MKTISLLPVRNEAWILDIALKNFSTFSDLIIVADQRSTDATRDICSQYPKVKVIENLYKGHSNKVRWLLLDEARKIEGNNLIFCLDADELMAPVDAEAIKNKMLNEEPGSAVSLPWIQLWGSLNKYRDDGVWHDNNKTAIFYDDGKIDYERNFVINDHTDRVPKFYKLISLPYPILHLQFAAKLRTALKQAWYRMNELIASPGTARKINHKYKDSLDSNSIRLKETPSKWTENIELPSEENLNSYDQERLEEIFSLFDQYSIEFFEPLEIWQVPDLHQKFLKEVGREPKTKTFPAWLIKLNDFRHKLRL